MLVRCDAVTAIDCACCNNLAADNSGEVVAAVGEFVTDKAGERVGDESVEFGCEVGTSSGCGDEVDDDDDEEEEEEELERESEEEETEEERSEAEGIVCDCN